MNNVILYPANWFDHYAPIPVYSTPYFHMEKQAVSVQMATDISYACLTLIDDMPEVVASTMHCASLDTAHIAESSGVSLDQPLMIYCSLSNSPVIPEQPAIKAKPDEAPYLIDHGTLTIWWLLIAKHLGESAVPAWLKRQCACLHHEQRRNKIPRINLTLAQIKEMQELLCLASAPITEFGYGRPCETFEQQVLEHFVVEFATVNFSPSPFETLVDKFWSGTNQVKTSSGVFLTQPMCDLLVASAPDSELVNAPLKDFFVKHANWFKDSGGVLMTRHKIH